MKYFIVPVAAALAFAAPAHATEFITQTINVAPTAAPDTDVISFAQFDSSLGTLESITLSFASSLIANGSVTNGSNASHTYTINGDSSASLTGHGFNFTQLLASGPIAAGSIGAHATKALAPISGSNNGSSTLLTGFDDFLGTGTIDFTFASTKTFTITPNAGTLSLLAQVGGAATLTYNYSLPVVPPTNDVPEPSSWALMLIGFGGMGAMMRRRRTSVAFG
jgi:PEP-CTERM motif